MPNRELSQKCTYYMTVNGIDEIPCRFDVVSIEDDRIIYIRMHLICGNIGEENESWITV